MSQPIDNSSSKPKLHKAKHINYWVRCLKTFLPTEYTSGDSNRMFLAFFILSALDVLDALESKTTSEERTSYIDWVYRSQHPEGGFCGSPIVSDNNNNNNDQSTPTTKNGSNWDLATLPSTYFGLAILAILRDDFSQVRRRECLKWLGRLQRQDGSFGEMLAEEGQVDGRRDVRYCYWAAGVRWILRSGEDEEKGDDDDDEVQDIDVNGVVRYINSSQTYDHGVAEAPFREAHAGHLYCAISALSFLDRLPPSVMQPSRALSTSSKSKLTGLSSLEGTVRWLVSRQIETIPENEDDDVQEEDHHRQSDGVTQITDRMNGLGFHGPRSALLHQEQDPGRENGSDHHAHHTSPPPAIPLQDHHSSLLDSPPPYSHFPTDPLSGTGDDGFISDIMQDGSGSGRGPTSSSTRRTKVIAGFNGRCNKAVDTCYSFWVCGSLSN
ncbi:MAG: hypothetical protein M1823_003484 [Watsoniomyces obsoletus]|nr:MAG: hypothetical protein M1823_003484 [Watsoniomyces obsoletus]